MTEDQTAPVTRDRPHGAQRDTVSIVERPLQILGDPRDPAMQFIAREAHHRLRLIDRLL